MHVLFKGFRVNSYIYSFKIWDGNVADTGHNTEVFNPMVVAQYIRLHPMNCSNQCALRLELYACNITTGKKRNATCITLYVQCITRCLLCIVIEQNKTRNKIRPILYDSIIAQNSNISNRGLTSSVHLRMR